MKLTNKLIVYLFLTLNIFIAASFAAEYPNADKEIVKIRIWNSELGGGSHYGHVSLQTNRSYVSLWPSGINRLDMPDVGCIKATARYNPNFQEDNREEEKHADSIYCLALDRGVVQAIDTKWQNLSSQNLIWFALGVNVPETNLSQLSDDIREHAQDFQNPLAFNCASIVYYLLTKVGGLNLEHLVSGVTCPHSPVVKLGLISILSGTDQLTKPGNMGMVMKIIYPDMVDYMLRHKIVEDIKYNLDYSIFHLNDKKIDYIWKNFLKTDADENNIEKFNTNKEAIERYIKGEYDQSPIGKLGNKFSNK